METRKPNPKTDFISDGMVHDHEHGEMGVVQAMFSVYLCPNCSNTHLEVQVRNSNTTLRFVCDPVWAERMGQALINPHPIDRDEQFDVRGTQH